MGGLTHFYYNRATNCWKLLNQAPSGFCQTTNMIKGGEKKIIQEDKGWGGIWNVG